MLGDIRQAKNVYIVTGYTDMRKGLKSLIPYVLQNFQMDPYEKGLFLFCGKKRDRMKALLWEGDGFILLYKVLDNGKSGYPFNSATGDAIIATTNRSNKLAPNLRLLKR